MSATTTIAAATASFFSAAEPIDDRSAEITSLFLSDIPASHMLHQETFQEGDSAPILLAQADIGEAVRNLALCAILSGGLEECADNIQRQAERDARRTNPDRRTQAGIERVADGYTSPNEIRGHEYIGQNRRTGVHFWDINVRGYGVVCAGAPNASPPDGQIMQIVQYNSCHEEAQRTPYPETDRSGRIITQQPQSPHSAEADYFYADGDNSIMGEFGRKYPGQAEVYPAVAPARSRQTGEVGCFEFEHREVDYGVRVDPEFCEGLTYPAR